MSNEMHAAKNIKVVTDGKRNMAMQIDLPEEIMRSDPLQWDIAAFNVCGQGYIWKRSSSIETFKSCSSAYS